MSNDNIRINILKECQEIPGVGKKLAQNLVNLGYRKIDRLHRESPEEMYQNLVFLYVLIILTVVFYIFSGSQYIIPIIQSINLHF